MVGWLVGWWVGWLVGSSHDRPSPRLNCPRGRQGADPIYPFFWRGESPGPGISIHTAPPVGVDYCFPLAHVDCARARPSPLRGLRRISRAPCRVGAVWTSQPPYTSGLHDRKWAGAGLGSLRRGKAITSMTRAVPSPGRALPSYAGQGRNTSMSTANLELMGWLGGFGWLVGWVEVGPPDFTVGPRQSRCQCPTHRR